MHWSSFPQLKLVESVGNAPTSTCLQGRCIACLPRPQKKNWQVALVLPQARLSFGDSAARAGARLVEIKRAGSCVGLWPSARTSRPVPFQQRTNTSWRSTRSQPAVSRRLFRCLGAHLLRSPSIVKSGLTVWALAVAIRGHTPSVELDRSFSPNSRLRPMTSFRCPFFSNHSVDPFVKSLMDKQKTLLTRGKQGLEILWNSITCLPPVYPIWVLDSHTPWTG